MSSHGEYTALSYLAEGEELESNLLRVIQSSPEDPVGLRRVGEWLPGDRLPTPVGLPGVPVEAKKSLPHLPAQRTSPKRATMTIRRAPPSPYGAP
jgi:hypothetical protein